MSEEKIIVLVVDDEPINIDLIKGVLPDTYKVKAAISGERALKIASKTPFPDVILLDVMMPEMDGYEVCRQLKADPVTKEIPVLFVTGNSDEAEVQKGKELGALATLGKPIDPATLIECIQRAVSR